MITFDAANQFIGFGALSELATPQQTIISKMTLVSGGFYKYLPYLQMGDVFMQYTSGYAGFRLYTTEYLPESGNIYIYYQAGFSGTVGQWRLDSTISPGTYHFAVSYDSGSLSNDPTFYLNGSAVAGHESYTPVGYVGLRLPGE